MSRRKQAPEFETIEKEAAFWEEHDTTEFVSPEEWAHVPLPDLAPSTKSLTVRVPEGLIVELKEAGRRRGVPYQSLLKTILYEWLQRETRPVRSRAPKTRKRA